MGVLLFDFVYICVLLCMLGCVCAWLKMIVHLCLCLCMFVYVGVWLCMRVYGCVCGLRELVCACVCRVCLCMFV